MVASGPGSHPSQDFELVVDDQRFKLESAGDVQLAAGDSVKRFVGVCLQYSLWLDLCRSLGIPPVAVSPLSRAMDETNVVAREALSVLPVVKAMVGPHSVAVLVTEAMSS